MKNKMINKIERKGTVTGFGLATSLTVYKRFIHYATNILLYILNIITKEATLFDNLKCKKSIIKFRKRRVPLPAYE